MQLSLPSSHTTHPKTSFPIVYQYCSALPFTLYKEDRPDYVKRMRDTLLNSSDFVQVLESEFQARLKRNQEYSLRAFSRDLDMPASRVCELLKRRRSISDRTAVKISKQLKFSARETEMFIQLVRCSATKSKLIQSAARDKIKSLLRVSKVKNISTPDFAMFGDWYYFAILEMTYLEGFQSLDAQKLSQFLDVPTPDIETAIKKLVNAHFLEKKGNTYVDKFSLIDAGDQIPSEHIRKFHRQLIAKAVHAIENRSLTDRFAGSTILAVREDQRDEARKAIEEFRLDFGARFGPNGVEKPDGLSALTIQFFKLSK